MMFTRVSRYHKFCISIAIMKASAPCGMHGFSLLQVTVETSILLLIASLSLKRRQLILTAMWSFVFVHVGIVFLISLPFSKSKKDETPSKYDEMAEIPGATYLMGSDDSKGRDGESPSNLVRVKSFKIDKYPVTNEQFRKFVRDTKYKTEAENFGWSFVLAPRVDPEIRKGIKEAVPVRPSQQADAQMN